MNVIKSFFKKIYNLFKHGRLNNGEPIGEAAKKTVIQIFIIFLIPVSIIGIMYAGTVLIEKTTDDGYLTVSMSSKYREPVRCSIPQLEDKTVTSGYAATEIVSKWSNSPITQKEIDNKEQGAHQENYITTTNYLFDTYLENCTYEQKSGLSNFELLSEIYYHIKGGGAVAVSLCIEDKKEETLSMGIGFVTSINYTDNAITVYLDSGIAEVFTTDDFIAATRFSDYDTSIFEKVGFAVGLYSINNAWFFSK
ncbi:MAG: hypothetical protein E7568_07505 [Ruminococcaceae bacterium]|nr:hypothetical protein [Oscillospiraceae bacterium]MBE6730124.1 hypothetical protein [Oscillospiraceae bacterium]